MRDVAQRPGLTAPVAVGRRQRARRGCLAGLWLALALVGAACGEPAVDIAIPERDPGQVVLDQAGILDDEAVAIALRDLHSLDVVALTTELDDPSLGAADRAGRRLIDEWGADVVLVAVAAPDDFLREGADGQRFFGLFAAEVREVPRDVRERIVEEIVPPLAAANDWTGVFVAAAAELAAAQPAPSPVSPAAPSPADS